MLLTMNASIALADKFHKNTGKGKCNILTVNNYLLSTD